jgi:DNA-binding beta-propeller fold protein YncE
MLHRGATLEGENMQKQHAWKAAGQLFLFAMWVVSGQAQDNLPLKLVQKIPTPGIQDSFDHMGVDIKGRRLFVAAHGKQQDTVEVIDLRAGKRAFSILGQSNPAGVFYSSDFKKLFVSNGADGTCKIFRADNFNLIVSLPVGPHANNVGYDPDTKYLYVGIGDNDSGSIALIDTRTDKHIGDIKMDSRPGGFTFEKSGNRVFTTLRSKTNIIGVVDRKKQEQIATWLVAGTDYSGSLALEESHHRLFVGTRNPPMLTVLDTDSGKQIIQLESVSHIDGLWYDAAHMRIYATGADGIAVYDQKDADHYTPMVKVPTEPNAPTSIWVPDFNRLYVGAPPNGSRDAEILVYEAQR